MQVLFSDNSFHISVHTLYWDSELTARAWSFHRNGEKLKGGKEGWERELLGRQGMPDALECSRYLSVHCRNLKKKKKVNETDPKRRQLKQTSFSSLTFKIFFFSLPCIGRPKFLSWVLAVLQLTSDSVQLCTLSQFSHLRQILRPKGPLSSSVGNK